MTPNWIGGFGNGAGGKNVLELGNGDHCTTLGIYQRTLNSVHEKDEFEDISITSQKKLPCSTATSPVLIPETMSLSSHSFIW